jgi:hypothetical protein
LLTPARGLVPVQDRHDATDVGIENWEGEKMGVYRLYTGSDGESHIEELGAEALRALKVLGTMTVSIQERTPGHFMDFHPAPFRRWQVGLVGRTLIGLSDGTSHTFGPGDVRLIEDTTGKGHTTTYLDGLTITMQIAPEQA